MTRNLFSYLCLLSMLLVFSCGGKKDSSSEERIKVVLREVGNQLLLLNKDSTSLVLPIVALSGSKYRLSFQSQLSFEPDDLVTIVTDNFQKSKLSDDYLVEVLQCKDKEVAYSYEISANQENTIIPCNNRRLPNARYSIEVSFASHKRTGFNYSFIVFILALLVLSLLGILFYKKRTVSVENEKSKNAIKIGRFKFYAEQNILVKEAEKISLSKKECELLEILVSKPNEVIKRDELTKRIWEDNGVFVGRSLDTYISKLRKKLKGDDSIKLTNIHGVGYKLEIKA